jgi:glycogen operon protein
MTEKIKDKTSNRDLLLKRIGTNFEISRGRSIPLGATILRDGINFAVFSNRAKSVSLVFFESCEKDPIAEFVLDPRFNKTGNVWHAFISGLDPGIIYGYRISVEGQDELQDIILLDPYSKATCGSEIWGKPAKINRNGQDHTFRISYIIEDTFDWGLDCPLNIPLQDTIIYELHARGYTQHSASGVKAPGTFLGLTEKIPYLKELGITAVELMPITDFDETDVDRTNPITGERLHNFWGYDPLGLFAPKVAYSSKKGYGEAVDEFKMMVKTFHEAGIEVLLDMVFNHTGEGNDRGPVYHFKGFGASYYYLLDPKTGEYLNYTGCGNTLNCNHPVVRNLIIDSLRYWVTEMHVDGFRFDLASVLGRGRDGSVLASPPLIEQIAEDPVLANTKLIAEAWDAAGLYQVGSFPHYQRWMELNGKFRDDIRSFVRGDRGMVPHLATRLAGSSDLYEDDGREPYHGVNFITNHDGFTLNDLVSYNHKHNEANGEDNRDGSDYNLSWNCGIEGPTKSKKVNQLRKRQMKNLSALLLLSQGVPMILAGDEFGNTQNGNNNVYCQDNEIGWLDWSLVEKNSDLLRFYQILIDFRKSQPNLRRIKFAVNSNDGVPEMSWHGSKLNHPNWKVESRSLGLFLSGKRSGQDSVSDIYMMFNAHWQQKRFELPALPYSKLWFRKIDTFLNSPEDILERGSEIKLTNQKYYKVQARSVVLLISL